MLQPTNGAYFFFLAPPFFAAFFFFAAIVLSMERVLNAGPIPRWIGRQQPDANTRLVPRARPSAQYCDRLAFSISMSCRATNRMTIVSIIRNCATSPVSLPDNHKGTHKVVKETSRTFKGGASNLPAALSEPASEATLSVCFRDAAKQGPRANAKRMPRI